MERKFYPYSLRSADAKIAGLCSTLGDMIGIDPTFLRIGVVASAVLISFKWTLIAYAAIAVYLVVRKKRVMSELRGSTDFDRMDEATARTPSVQAMRTDLDVNDRRMMAIDHHLNSPNDQLAREIEALRQEDQ